MWAARGDQIAGNVAQWPARQKCICSIRRNIVSDLLAATFERALNLVITAVDFIVPAMNI